MVCTEKKYVCHILRDYADVIPPPCHTVLHVHIQVCTLTTSSVIKSTKHVAPMPKT